MSGGPGSSTAPGREASNIDRPRPLQRLAGRAALLVGGPLDLYDPGIGNRDEDAAQTVRGCYHRHPVHPGRL